MFEKVQRLGLITGLIAVNYCSVVRAAGPYKSLADIFQGQLANLTRTLDSNPYLGGQSFTQCCNLAVNESLTIVNGNLEFKPRQTFLHGNVSTFLSYQYPCTASYNGSQGDQPQVTIPYSWCHQNCPGWSKTEAVPESDWVEPLIAFILPTIVFCFTIPRRRTITIPSYLFPSSRFFVFPQNLTLVYAIPTTCLLVVLDAVLWVVTCVVVSGPMLLSGSLELLLDSRTLRFLESPENKKYLSVQQRSQLLLILLIGNLDHEPAWKHSNRVLGLLHPSTYSGVREIPVGLPDIRVQKDASPASSSSSAPSSSSPQSLKKDIGGTSKQQTPVSAQNHTNAVKTKLTSLLQSQQNFGASVGIGVIFYTSSFFYTVVQIKANYGDGATSNALAFGIFWMTVGHIAVVAGVLIADNSPSAWEAVAADAEDGPSTIATCKNLRARRHDSAMGLIRHWFTTSMERQRVVLPPQFKTLFYRPAYPSKYKVAWMWSRGHNKAMWLSRFVEEHPHLDRVEKEILHLGWYGWLLGTTVPTMILYIVPAFLGGLTSYTTPTIGMSCRSMIPLIYSSAQTVLVILWLLDWNFWKRGRGGKLLNAQQLQKQRRRMSLADFAWYFWFLLSGATAILTAVGGTLFQLIGLYRNCLCYIPIRDWTRRWDPSVTMYLSSNSSEQIYYAKRYWLPIGVAATLFLVATTYLGWQYQHRLRRRFMDAVECIGSTHESKECKTPEGQKSSPELQQKVAGGAKFEEGRRPVFRHSM